MVGWLDGWVLPQGSGVQDVHLAIVRVQDHDAVEGSTQSWAGDSGGAPAATWLLLVLVPSAAITGSAATLLAGQGLAPKALAESGDTRLQMLATHSCYQYRRLGS